ncbi:PAS domain S-box protein [Bacillus benzoevorans]|uniref:Diguanylate cyclase (GGDEF)-like protein/PAS domain S-box-containing protein n=1 Tax=Bacillus benzoevorans TaxID=1456 RepID=A0A7X0LX96_9BACI|nr:PAS domain S-box protein [Bacillus benzoevorans]MBB6447941.1 diguanylate cyclase (GGDEF)-like protein/PAS domain S-box-containing protein [Bacillus benzoevorans]
MKHFIEKVGRDVLSLTSILDAIVDLVFLMKVDGDSFRYIFVNESAKKVLNTKDNILGKRLEEAAPKEVFRILAKKYRQARLTKKPLKFRETLKTANGEFYGETTLSPIIKEDGECSYVMAIVRDITERIQRERQLKETQKTLVKQQKRLHSLLENNGDAVIEFDREGNFVEVNKITAEVTGYQEYELLGTSFIPLIAEESLEDTMRYFERALSGSKEEFETIIKHAEGQKIQVAVKNIPIIIDGVLDGVYCIAKDVTETKRIEEEIHKKTEEIEAFWTYTSDPIVFFNMKGEVERINPAFEKTFEFAEKEIIGPVKRIIPPEAMTEAEEIWERIGRGETIALSEVKRLTKSGAELTLLASYTPLHDKGGVLLGTTAFYKNITELKQTERELRKSQEKYRIVTENAFDVIKLINTSGIIEYVSPSNEEIIGYTPSEYIGKRFTEHLHPDDIQRLEKEFKKWIHSASPKTTTVELQFLHKKGHYIWLEAVSTPVIEDGKVKQIVTITRDITGRKRLRERLAKLAFYDQLSGLPNRRIFYDRLHMAMKHAERNKKKAALMMIDGSKFKLVNDTYGHDAGDAVIQEMAKRIKAAVRKIDTVARLGGDEMAVILPDLSSQKEAENVKQRILKAFQKPLYFNGNVIQMNVDIGIALYPDHAAEQKQLIRLADQALYKVKESHRYDLK